MSLQATASDLTNDLRGRIMVWTDEIRKSSEAGVINHIVLDKAKTRVFLFGKDRPTYLDKDQQVYVFDLPGDIEEL